MKNPHETTIIVQISDIGEFILGENEHSSSVVHRERPTAQCQQNQGADCWFEKKKKEEQFKVPMNLHHREPEMNIIHLHLFKKPQKQPVFLFLENLRKQKQTSNVKLLCTFTEKHSDWKPHKVG